jgi:hypothetical protein
MMRPLALTIPVVTVCPRPNGFGEHVPMRSARRAELYRGQVFRVLQLEEREIELGVAPDDHGLELPFVDQAHLHLVGVGDHVLVGDHVASRVDDEAGARAHALARTATLPTAEELEGVARRQAHLLGGGDVHHCWLHLVGEVGHVEGRGHGGRGQGSAHLERRQVGAVEVLVVEDDSVGRCSGQMGRLGRCVAACTAGEHEKQRYDQSETGTRHGNHSSGGRG